MFANRRNHCSVSFISGPPTLVLIKVASFFRAWIRSSRSLYTARDSLSPKVLSLSPLPLSLSAPFTFRCSCLFCSFPASATGSSQEKLFCFHFRHFTTFLLLPLPLLFLLLQLRNFSRSSLWGEGRKGCLPPLLPEVSQLLLQLSFTALHFFCSEPRRAAGEATHCILAQKRKVCPGAEGEKKGQDAFWHDTGTAKLLGKRFDFIFRTFVAASHTASDALFYTEFRSHSSIKAVWFLHHHMSFDSSLIPPYYTTEQSETLFSKDPLHFTSEG